MRAGMPWTDVVAGLATGVALGAAPLAATGALHAPGPLASVIGLYALLGLAVWSGARCLVRIPWTGRALAAALLGGLLFWQLREQGDWLHAATRPVATGAALGLCGLGAAAAVRRPERAPWALCALSTAALCAAAALCDRADPTLHWHLRAHHRLFASVLHRAFDAPVVPIDTLFDDARVARRATPAAAAPPAAPAERGHVVFVLVDTLRADALGSYGARPSPTPALDQRAAGAVRFTDVRSNAPWTSASVASMLTGRLPEETGLYELGDALPRGATTAAEVFRAWGYETAGFVANAAVAASLGFDQGFARYREVPAPGAYPRADAVVDEVAAWLAARPEPTTPLFLYVHFMDPHVPYLSGGAPAITAPEHSRAAYARELRFLDGQLERLFRALDASLPGSLRIVLTADHGEEFGEHGGFEHGHTLYQELLAVPLAVAGLPVTGSGGAGLVDVVPTLLAALGAAPHDGAGRDLRVPAAAAAYRSSNPLYGDLDRRAVRRGRLKLVVRDGHRAFYDLLLDPGEYHPRSDAGAEGAALASLLPPGRIDGRRARPLAPGVRAALEALGYAPPEPDGRTPDRR